jgi:hypothetical protein
LIAAGCPAALLELGEGIGAQGMIELFESLGFYSAPDIGLAVAEPGVSLIRRVDMASIGQDSLTVTPLQLALAAASLANEGLRPAPRLVTAVNAPDVGWQSLPTAPAVETVLTGKENTAEIMEAMAPDGQPFWEVTALARSSTRDLSWYVAGSLPNQAGARVALVVVLEERNPHLARQIGQSILEDVIGQP